MVAPSSMFSFNRPHVAPLRHIVHEICTYLIKLRGRGRCLETGRPREVLRSISTIWGMFWKGGFLKKVDLGVKRKRVRILWYFKGQFWAIQTLFKVLRGFKS